MALTKSYVDYRMNRINTNIEFFGGFSNLSDEEKRQYKIFREYLRVFAALKELGLTDKDAEASVEQFMV
jgi:hypothetical protein